MMVSLQEAYENYGRARELCAEIVDIIDSLAVSPVRVDGELRGTLRQTEYLLKLHQQAAEVMMTMDLADTFPDGSAAPNTLTVRQIMYLAALAMPSAKQVRESLGLPPTRACTQEYEDGSKCAGSSMLFTNRAICYAHGTPAERARNKKAKAAFNTEHPDNPLK